MALTAGELSEIVWAETRALGVGRLDGTGEVNAVRAMVARLAAARLGVGFPRRTPLPRTDDPRLGETARAIMAIADAAKDARDPQNRLLIWIAGADSARIERQTNPPPPEPWATLPASAITNQFRGQLPASGQLVDMFSRAPLAGEADGLAFVNALSGTGLPGETPLAAAAPLPPKRPVSKTSAWTLGITGSLLFLLAAGNIVWTGRQTGMAIEWMKGNLALTLPSLAPSVQAITLGERMKCFNLLTAPSPTEAEREGGVAPDEVTNACVSTWTEAMLLAGKNFVAPSILLQAGTWPELSYVFGWNAPTNGRPAQVAVPVIVMALGLVGLAAGLGLGVRGTVWGAVLNRQNRVSLALTQVMCWTALVLPTIIGFAVFKAGLFIPSRDQQAANITVFPTMPPEILAALGITLASPLLSRLVNSSKDAGATGLGVLAGAVRQQNSDVGFMSQPTSLLQKREDAASASVADLFLGEETNNEDQVDISRLQMVVITVGLLLAYGQLLYSQATGISIARAANKAFAESPDGLFSSLPSAGQTFTILLAVSHGAYLITKAANKGDRKTDI